MPKRLENVRGRLIQISRDLLLNEGYERLTLREAAARCHIAVGTIYNYFPSREMLIAEVLLGDWMETMKLTREKALHLETVMEGLECIYDGIAGFTQRYQPTWNNYKHLTCSVDFYRAQHQKLMSQVEDAVGEILQVKMTGKKEADDPEQIAYLKYLPHFIAQNILADSVSGEPFMKRKIAYEKLLM